MSSRGYLRDQPGRSPALPDVTDGATQLLAADGRRLRSAVSARYGRRDYLTRRLLLVADAISILLALTVTLTISPRDRALEYVLLGFATLPVWLALFKAYELYDRDIKRISHSTVDDIPWILHALLVGSLLLWIYYKLLPTRQLVLEDAVSFAVISTVAVITLRFASRRFAIKALGPERVLLIGDGESTELLLHKMQTNPAYGLEPVGLVSHSASSRSDTSVPLLEIGDADLGELLARSRADRLVICNSHLDESELLELVHRCKQQSVKVSVLPQFFGAMGPSVEVDDVEGVTVLGINPPVLPRSSRLMKRSMDLIGSGCILLLAAPVMLLIATAIKIESRGPVFFKQRRIGKGGHPFKLVKFRTMVVDAEQQTAELLSQSQHAGWLKLEHDPRVTRVGRVLRLTSLDELPEFWSVLKGDMSLVGPRPLIESEDRQVAGWARSRLDLTPGITGLWQVLGRTNIPFEEMVKLDYLYVTNWSLWGDTRLILRTLPVVLSRRGAN